MFRIRHIFFVLLFVIVLPRHTYAYGNIDETYLERISEHFIIHYPKSREDFAERALQYAEEAHFLISNQLQSKPAEKTHISVLDEIDVSNGSAIVVPRNEIKLYAWPPVAFGELGNYDDWLRILVFHEYTHILHVDTNDNILYDVLNTIFGKFARENATLPRWFTEGFAVYSETLHGTGGRLRSALYRTMMRQIAIDKKIPTLGEMSVEPIAWPGGSAPYLFGSFFMQWVADTYGLEKIAEFIHAYSRKLIPYAMNRTAVDVFGKTWEQLWNAWREDVISKSIQEKETFERQQKSSNVTLLLKPHRHGSPKVRPNSNSFAYYYNDGIHRTQLRLAEVQNRTAEDIELKEQEIAECRGTCAYDWSPDGRKLYFTHLETIDGYKNRSSLFVYQFDTNKVERMTSNLHVRAVSVTSKYIYLIIQNKEHSEVIRFDSNDSRKLQNPEIIYKSLDYEQIDHLSVSEIGTEEVIAITRFNVNRKHHEVVYQSVNLLKEGVREWKHLPLDIPTAEPQWESSEPGVLSVTASLDDGTFQRLRILSTGEIRQQTHVLGGVLSSSVFKDGAIVFETITSEGKTLGFIRSEDVYDEPLDGKTITSEEDESEADNSYFKVSSTVRNYHPIRWLLPQTWTPLFSGSTDGAVIGLSFGGRDFLDHHNYNISASYDTKINNINFSMDYHYLRLLWDINASIEIKNQEAAWFNTRRIQPYIYRKHSASVWATRQVSGRLIQNMFVLRADIAHTDSSTHFYWSKRDPAAAPPIFPDLGWQNSLGFSYVLSNLRQGEKSPSANDGQNLRVNLRFEAPWLGDKGYALIASTSANFYWIAPWYDLHTLHLSVSAGTSLLQDSTRVPYQLNTTVSNDFGTLDATVHGYEPGVLTGQHYLYAHAEYRMTLLSPILGSSTLPLGLRDIQLTLYTEWAGTWLSDSLKPLMSAPAVGASLHFDFTLGYRLIQRITVGYAYGDSHQVYFGLF